MKCIHCKTDITGEPLLDLGKGKIDGFLLHEQCGRIRFGLLDEPKLDFSHMVGPDVRRLANQFELYLNYNKGNVIVVDSVPTQFRTSSNSTFSTNHFSDRQIGLDIAPITPHEDEPSKGAQFKRNKFDRLKQSNKAKVLPSKFFQK